MTGPKSMAFSVQGKGRDEVSQVHAEHAQLNHVVPGSKGIRAS